jgi:hypothetical protein
LLAEKKYHARNDFNNLCLCHGGLSQLLVFVMPRVKAAPGSALALDSNPRGRFFPPASLAWRMALIVVKAAQLASINANCCGTRSGGIKSIDRKWNERALSVGRPDLADLFDWFSFLEIIEGTLKFYVADQCSD